MRKPADSVASSQFEEISPTSLLSMVTNSDVARGKLVGEETLNGTKVRHYLIDGNSFLKAAQNSSNPQLKAFAQNLWAAKRI
jgi:hypothetical protein